MDGVTKEIQLQLANRFNQLVGEFIRKMMSAFPSDAVALKSLYTKLLLGVKLKPDVAIRLFGDNLKQFAHLVDSKSDELFAVHSQDISLFTSIDMKSNWAGATQETKDAVWSYVNVLKKMSDTFTSSGGTVNALAQHSQQALSDFKSKTGRAPNDKDDMSAYTLQVADKMGLDMRGLEDVDLPRMRSEIENMDLSNIPELKALGMRVNKAQARQITGFAMKQLEALQRRQRMRQKLEERKVK